jgi:hypothetical protein
MRRLLLRRRNERAGRVLREITEKVVNVTNESRGSVAECNGFTKKGEGRHCS